MSTDYPSDEEFTQYAQQRIALYPEKFGVMGSYSKELMRCQTAEDMLSYGADMLLMRLTTAVLCGQTISEKPQVELSMPATPWQHLKYRISKRHERLNARWEGQDPDTWAQTTPPPWVILLWPFLVLFSRWLKKHKVQFTTVTADIEFEQRVLYPEIDAPAHAGRPVIYETLSVNYPYAPPPFGSRLINDPSRFLNRHEIASEIYRDPDINSCGIGGPSYLGVPDLTLRWLERHGVNVDQLVKRR